MVCAKFLLGWPPHASFLFRCFFMIEMIPASECVNGKADFSHILKSQRCSKKYPHLKATWARHALFRDWLQECETCTGPVLYIDSRDAYFQDDPFGPGSPPVKGLNLYQVGDGASTKASFVGNAILQCKNRTYNEPMLCAGSTVGTKAAMVKYLEIMVKEIEAWMDFPDCAFSDQGIHNHLFYSGQLPFAKSMVSVSCGRNRSHFATAAGKRFVLTHIFSTSAFEGKLGRRYREHNRVCS